MPKYLDSTYDLAANTYTAREQSFAVCEVGDAKQPMAFYPQVKIMRWDNECNFSARLVHEESNPEVALVADKIQWIGDAVEAHFYEVGEGKEGGGYEFEIILKDPPKSNVISMTLQTKGLDFFYQPFMKNINPDGSFWEESASGRCSCPANVGGSYAVYHKTMAGDYTAMGGKNYLAGKAFHIYRPRIEDAEGNWVWGDLNIDEKAGLLTVTIPQDFLDKAVYPVRHAAGLEFGYHATGGGSQNHSSTQWVLIKSQGAGGDPALPGSSGTLVSISTYTKLTWGSPVYNPSLYVDSSGTPGNKIAGVNSGGTVVGVDYAWITTPITGSIVAGTQYWLGIGGCPGGTVHSADYYPGNVMIAVAEIASWPSPWTGGSLYGGWTPCIYATYTAAAAAGQATAKRFGGVPHMAINKGVW